MAAEQYSRSHFSATGEEMAEPTARAMGKPDLRGGWSDGGRWPKDRMPFRLYRGFAFA
jgi:hypothetical protein